MAETGHTPAGNEVRRGCSVCGSLRLQPMFAEAARQGIMPAIAMSDHGNMFGAYEFQQVAEGFDGVKPITSAATSNRRPKRSLS